MIPIKYQISLINASYHICTDIVVCPISQPQSLTVKQPPLIETGCQALLFKSFLSRCPQTKRRNEIQSTGQSHKRSQTSRAFVELAEKFVKKDDGKFYCAIDEDSGCQYYQAKYEAGNMIRHFRLKHATLAEAYGMAKNDPPEKKQRIITKKQVAVDRRLVVEACVKLVAEHNLPLRCFDWDGLKMLLDPLAAAVGINITRSNIKLHLENTAAKIRAAISSEARDKLISLMLDSATRLGRHILGISIQYSLNDKLVIRTLGKIYLTDSILRLYFMLIFSND